MNKDISLLDWYAVNATLDDIKNHDAANTIEGRFKYAKAMINERNKYYSVDDSLRDWLAANATENDIRTHGEGIISQNGVKYKDMVMTREKARYKYADAMLEARKK